MDKNMEDAVRFIGLELKDHPDTDRAKLIDEVSRRFDLSPLQTEFLINKYVLSK